MKRPEIKEELIKAVALVLKAKAYTNTVKPIVETYQQEIIDREQFRYDEEWINHESDRMRPDGEIVTKESQSHLMDDQDAERYYDLLDQAHKDHGFEVNPRYCPLLIAESDERSALRLMFEKSHYLHNIDPERYIPMNKRKEMQELIIKMVVAYAKENHLDLKNY